MGIYELARLLHIVFTIIANPMDKENSLVCVTCDGKVDTFGHGSTYIRCS